MERGIISTLKAYYLMQAFEQAIDATVEDQALCLAVFWKKYDIKHTTEDIQASWQEGTASNMGAIQQRLSVHCANNFAEFKSNINGVVEEMAVC